MEMKNISIYAVASVAVLLGFALAWLIKPSDTNPARESDNQHILESHDQIWTCSMHPQVRQGEPGLCPICEMDLVPLQSASSDDPLVLQMTNEAVKLANIQTTIVGQAGAAVDKILRLSGKIQADERLASSQVAHVPGRIEKLYVTFTGEQVYAGQKLVDIYSPELITAQNELLEAKKLQSLNPSLIEAARNKLRFWKIGDDVIKAIEQDGQIRETFALHADASGIITQRRIAVGDYVKQGEAMFDLMSLRKVWVLFDAYEADLNSVSIGDQITFSTPSLPNRNFNTRITFIDPIIDPQTRVASLRTEVNNRQGLLKPEMFVSGILTKKGTKGGLVTVPKSAVLWTGKRSVVYVKQSDSSIPSFQYREVELGEAIGDNYQIIDGIESGDEVVTYGSFAIDAAAQLNNQASMMNKDVLLKGMQHSDHLPDFTDVTPMEFKRQLSGVTDLYLGVKDALVQTDAAKTAKAATQLLANLKKVNMSPLTGESHLFWMKQLEALQSHTTKISELSDVEEQRDQFDFLSQALIQTIKVFGIPDGAYYVQHCPMAADDHGADWISNDTEILNPYFGDKMLKCGFVEDTITKDFRNTAVQETKVASKKTHRH